MKKTDFKGIVFGLITYLIVILCLICEERAKAMVAQTFEMHWSFIAQAAIALAFLIAGIFVSWMSTRQRSKTTRALEWIILGIPAALGMFNTLLYLQTFMSGPVVAFILVNSKNLMAVGAVILGSLIVCEVKGVKRHA
ncbi:MAG: hypothetical protein IJ017_07540 [Oscillospiraceae bacterium]|nr:hypothetical protein [Oscillospiraceae bacterium]